MTILTMYCVAGWKKHGIGWSPRLPRNARETVEREAEGAESLVPTYERALSAELARQQERPYFLAESLITETGYRQAGEYYWIVERLSNRVRWVSGDYFIYEDSVEGWRL